MTDVALTWSQTNQTADLTLVGGDLAVDHGLTTAVIISLFTDRRARSDDPLPQQGDDRRGWWGDVFAQEAADLIGSRLWLLSREKQTAQVATRAREYILEALAWMLADRVASAVDVTTEIPGTGTLAISVFITRPGGPDRLRFDFVWQGTT